MPETSPPAREPAASVQESARQFAEQAQADRPRLVGELLAFLRENKKWWLLPIILVLGIVGLLVVLGSSVVAPFIYPLF